MDFLTHKSLSEPPGQAAFTNWARAAISSLAAFDRSEAILPTHTDWSADLVKNTVTSAQRHTSSLHSHGYFEACVCVGGCGLMELADGMAVLSAPGIFFAPPHTPHCQARTAEKTFHALVWLTVSRKEMLFVSSSYRPEKGWSDPERASLQGEDVRRLSEKLHELAKAPSVAALEVARAEMLEAVNRIYQQAARRPTQGNSESWDYHKPVLGHIRSYIDNNLDAHLSLKELGEMARLSPNYLNQMFKQWTGQPIHQYTIRRRMETAMQKLRDGNVLVKQVARQVGYDDPLYFSRAFHDYYGEWPGKVSE